jgi:replicative DNA helicase
VSSAREIAYRLRGRVDLLEQLTDGPNPEPAQELLDEIRDIVGTNGHVPPPTNGHDPFYDAGRRRQLLHELLAGRGRAEFAWPFEALNQASAGGLRRHQLVVVSGYRGDGKSHFIDQLLDTNRKRGHKVALYDNEMDPAEREARSVVRHVPTIPYARLLDGRLDEAQRARIEHRIASLPDWPILEIPGWTGEQVIEDIGNREWDLAVVDILHNFRFADERELSTIVSGFKAAAGLLKCCIVLVAHVSRRGMDRVKPRPPVCADLRWTGDIENLADIVCFVYRERDDEDPPQPTAAGSVYFDKCRNGKLGSQAVEFNPMRLRFDLAGAELAEEAA